MNKNLIWIGVMIVLVIGAYFVGSNKLSTPKTSIQSGSLTQNELFDKKAECSKYDKQIRDDMEQDQYVMEALYQIFYSPVKNTCLSAKYVLYPAHGTVEEGEILRIDDILTGENVWMQTYHPEMKYWEADAILDQQITILK